MVRRTICILLTLVCWSIWNRHNKWVWDKIKMCVFDTTHAAINLLADWKRAQLELTKQKPVATSGIRRGQVPQRTWVKVNLDAAMFTGTTSIGIGGVTRDEAGGFIRVMCKQMEDSWSPREAEALSLKKALSWTKQNGFIKSVFETDSKLLADACNGSTGRFYFHSIVIDCMALFKHFESVLAQFLHSSENYEVTRVLV